MALLIIEDSTKAVVHHVNPEDGFSPPDRIASGKLCLHPWAIILRPLAPPGQQEVKLVIFNKSSSNTNANTIVEWARRGETCRLFPLLQANTKINSNSNTNEE